MDEVFGFSVDNGVQFGSATTADGQVQILRMDVFQPRGDSEARRPVVIWLHGGSFTSGGRGQMTSFARAFARRGFVSASIDYRLRPGADFDYTDPADEVGQRAARDAQHDAQAAVRWFRANASELRIDPQRIIVAGYSAGGTAALRVAARPGDAGASGNPGQASDVAAVVAISGSVDPGTMSALAVPVLLIHGEQDRKVGFARMAEACGSSANCQLVAVPDADHTLSTFQAEAVLSATASFVVEEVLEP